MENIVTIAPTATIDTLDAYDLAKLAEVAGPADYDSPGASFLLGVRDALTDHIGTDGLPDERAVQEIADGAVPVSSTGTWRTFTDLSGWQVDTTDLTGDRISASRLTEHAEAVLHLVGERLLTGLLLLVAEPA